MAADSDTQADRAMGRPEVGGPYLTMAVLCEKVLREADGPLSLIRIIDRLILTIGGPEAPAQMPSTPVNVTAIIGFKSGFARGPHTARIKLVSPSHREINTVEMPMLLEGDDRGANLVLQLGFEASEEGVYWFDVYLVVEDQEVLATKMPLRLLYRRMSVSQ